MNSYFLVSFLILSALLFIPVSKLIWVISIRRIQKKTNTELSQSEIDEQLTRARVIAVFLVSIFSFLFISSIGIRP